MKNSRLRSDPAKVSEWKERSRRRTPLRRRTGLSRTSIGRRREPIRRVNPERRRRRFVRAFGSEARVRWIKSLPCLVCQKCPSENAHIKSRAAGGTERHVIPLCGGPDGHHRQQHDMGTRSFARMHGLNLEAEARRVAEAWDEMREIADVPET